MCWWLAADFDGPAAMLDALAYLKAARAAKVPATLEVSRSGVRAHAWIFFGDETDPDATTGSSSTMPTNPVPPFAFTGTVPKGVFGRKLNTHEEEKALHGPRTRPRRPPRRRGLTDNDAGNHDHPTLGRALIRPISLRRST
jgi:hypothetical protein